MFGAVLHDFLLLAERVQLNATHIVRNADSRMMKGDNTNLNLVYRGRLEPSFANFFEMLGSARGNIFIKAPRRQYDVKNALVGHSDRPDLALLFRLDEPLPRL